MIETFSTRINALISEGVLAQSVRLPGRFLKAQWRLNTQIGKVSREWNRARHELADVGLLYAPESETDDGYLDQIELQIAVLPSISEAGYVYESTGFKEKLLGYRPGVIYLPRDLPYQAYVPGGTLVDVIRHEYAHAWHWLEPEFFEQPWFYKAFGGSYDDGETVPSEVWVEKMASSRSFRSRLNACRNEREVNALWTRLFRKEFVSEYASTLICEDFAESFMTYLRCRRSLEKFKSRAGVYRKLKAVEKAVAQARLELGT